MPISSVVWLSAYLACDDTLSQQVLITMIDTLHAPLSEAISVCPVVFVHLFGVLFAHPSHCKSQSR